MWLERNKDKKRIKESSQGKFYLCTSDILSYLDITQIRLRLSLSLMYHDNWVMFLYTRLMIRWLSLCYTITCGDLIAEVAQFDFHQTPWDESNAYYDKTNSSTFSAASVTSILKNHFKRHFLNNCIHTFYWLFMLKIYSCFYEHCHDDLLFISDLCTESNTSRDSGIRTSAFTGWES